MQRVGKTSFRIVKDCNFLQRATRALGVNMNNQSVSLYDEQYGWRRCLDVRSRALIHTSSAPKKKKRQQQQRPASSSAPSAANSYFSDDCEPLLFDVDCNLTHADMEKDIEEHIKGAKDSGICGMIVPGSTVEESRTCIEIAKTYGSGPFVVKTTVGVHPYHAGGWGGEEIRQMKEMIMNTTGIVAAVGECGLDYSDGFPDRSLQLPVFEEQVKLSCELKLPLFLHQRGAFDDFVRVMECYRPNENGINVLVHCFTGDQREIDWILSQKNYFLSFSGIICKDGRGDGLRSVLAGVGRDELKHKIMVETDAPYLGFPGCRSACASKKKRQYPNVPSALPRVVDELAKCLGVPEDEKRVFARELTNTARSFFSCV